MGSAIRPDARFLLIGVYFGFVLVKAEVVSWYRIQEMFRFHAFHMYGVIGTALVVAALTVWAVRRFGLASIDGRRLHVEPMPPGWRRYAFGGTLFGVGWALAGACPGPIAALVGAGLWPFTVVFASAWLGTLAYGVLRHRLPH
jgi:uncharacterized protein